jgi:hypothetical protein
MANKIMLIRHAEKPDGGPPPRFGVDESGQPNPEELVIRGWQRAGALACLFSPLAAPGRDHALATPQAIYATSATQHHARSRRPQHTVGPLAARLGLTPNIEFALGQEAALVEDAKAAAGPVLIAWHHEAAAAIANKIVGDTTTCPQTWPDDRFDIIWVFDLPAGQTVWNFSQVPQLMLAGDRTTPL